MTCTEVLLAAHVLYDLLTYTSVVEKGSIPGNPNKPETKYGNGDPLNYNMGTLVLWRIVVWRCVLKRVMMVSGWRVVCFC